MVEVSWGLGEVRGSFERGMHEHNQLATYISSWQRTPPAGNAGLQLFACSTAGHGKPHCLLVWPNILLQVLCSPAPS